jgi:hypothetical protein
MKFYISPTPTCIPWSCQQIQGTSNLSCLETKVFFVMIRNQIGSKRCNLMWMPLNIDIFCVNQIFFMGKEYLVNTRVAIVKRQYGWSLLTWTTYLKWWPNLNRRRGTHLEWKKHEKMWNVFSFNTSYSLKFMWFVWYFHCYYNYKQNFE